MCKKCNQSNLSRYGDCCSSCGNNMIIPRKCYYCKFIFDLSTEYCMHCENSYNLKHIFKEVADKRRQFGKNRWAVKYSVMCNIKYINNNWLNKKILSFL